MLFRQRVTDTYAVRRLQLFLSSISKAEQARGKDQCQFSFRGPFQETSFRSRCAREEVEVGLFL